jgi:hypothetical protein
VGGGRAPGPICEEPRLALDRVGSAVRRAFTRLPGETGAKLASLLEPTALATLVATLLLWAGSHLLGVGEAIDILMRAT